MKIGVDAGALAVKDERLKVGVWRDSVNLLSELGKLDHTNAYRLYSFSPIDKKLLSRFGDRMTNVLLSPTKGYFSVRLPIELKLNPVDIFLGLSQAIPKGVKKSIAVVHDLGFLHHPEAYPDSLSHLTRQAEEACQRAIHFIAVSKSTANDLHENYKIPFDKITVAYPGVDERFTPKGKKFTANNPYFLFVGSLKRGKNLLLALKAYAKILPKIKRPVDFIIIGGDYWRDPKIDETMETFHLEDRVKLLGFVSDEELIKYYRGAISLIIPSLWEGFGLPAVEAMASGCPVICSDAGALPEIVEKAGIVVHDFEEENFVQAMSLILNNKEKRKKMIKDGLNRAKIFSWSNFGKKVLEAINEI